MSSESMTRLRQCSGPIIAVALLAMTLRVIYIFMTDEFEGNPLKKRLDWRFPFMQIKIINMWMLFWPLTFAIGVLAYLYLQNLTKVAKDFFKDVLVRWLTSYCLFMIYYYYWSYASGTQESDFDPSGHVTCSLVAQSCFMATHLFTTRQSTTS